MEKALFLDLDGTVRETISGEKFINNPQDQQLISGVEEALVNYQDYLIFGITNQAGVEQGYKSIKDAITEQKITLALCPEIRLILFCPDKKGQDLWIVSHYNFGVKLKLEDTIKPSLEEEYFLDPDTKIPPREIPNYDSFRKPGIGAIQYLLDSFLIDLEKSLMIGDLESDQKCAAKAGCDFMWADEWRNL